MSIVDSLKEQIELCVITNEELLDLNKEIEAKNTILFKECTRLTKEFKDISEANFALCLQIEKLEKEHDLMAVNEINKIKDLENVTRENSFLFSQVQSLEMDINIIHKKLITSEVTIILSFFNDLIIY